MRFLGQDYWIYYLMSLLINSTAVIGATCSIIPLQVPDSFPYPTVQWFKYEKEYPTENVTNAILKRSVQHGVSFVQIWKTIFEQNLQRVSFIFFYSGNGMFRLNFCIVVLKWWGRIIDIEYFIIEIKSRGWVLKWEI